jgi:hypothetical protein
MTLSDLGNLGGFVSGIAVAITLIYLAVQVRLSTEIARATMRQSLVQNQIAHMSLRSTDPMIRAAFRKATAHEQLDEDERFALLFHATVGIRMWEASHSQLEHGMLSKEDWFVLRHIISTHLQLPIYRQALEPLGTRGVNPRFLAEVNRIIEQIPASIEGSPS